MATLLVNVEPPPKPSIWVESAVPIAPMSTWSRKAMSSGSHSFKKKGPRDVPARINTQCSV
jgi:hypothetical protein